MRTMIFLITIGILMLMLFVMVKQQIISDIIKPLIRHSPMLSFGVFLAILIFLLAVVKLLLSYGRR